MDTSVMDEEWWADAGSLASHRGLPVAARLVWVVMCLAVPEQPGVPEKTETEWAVRCGMTKHQVRQAIAALRREGVVERGWSIGPGRPVAIFRPAVGDYDVLETAG